MQLFFKESDASAASSQRAAGEKSVSSCQLSDRHNWSPRQNRVLAVLHDNFEKDWQSFAVVINAFICQEDPVAPYQTAVDTERQVDYIKMMRSRVNPKEPQSFSPAYGKEADEICAQLERICLSTKRRLVRTSHILAHRKRTLEADTPTTPEPMHPDEISLGLLTPPPTGKRHCPEIIDLDNSSSPPLNCDSPSRLDRHCQEIVDLERLNPQRLDRRSPFPSERHERRPLPPIAFRAFTKKSLGINSALCFRAGAFVDKEQIASCPGELDGFYRSEATRHIEYDQSAPTPFISLTINPIRAMVKGSGGKSSGSVSLIDLRKLAASQHVVNAIDLKLKPNAIYYGKDEYLVWGQIPREAIISTVSMASVIENRPYIPGDQDPFALMVIQRAFQAGWARDQIRCQGIKDLSYFGGHAIGQLARSLSVKEKFLEDLTDVVLRDWAFKLRKASPWRDNEVFTKGLHKGYSEEVPEDWIRNSTRTNDEREPDTERSHEDESLVERADVFEQPEEGLIQQNFVASEVRAEQEPGMEIGVLEFLDGSCAPFEGAGISEGLLPQQGFAVREVSSDTPGPDMTLRGRLEMDWPIWVGLQ